MSNKWSIKLYSFSGFLSLVAIEPTIVQFLIEQTAKSYRTIIYSRLNKCVIGVVFVTSPALWRYKNYRSLKYKRNLFRFWPDDIEFDNICLQLLLLKDQSSEFRFIALKPLFSLLVAAPFFFR